MRVSWKAAGERFADVFSIDARALGAFRIGIALILLYDLFGKALILDALLTDDGLIPIPEFYGLVRTASLWSVHAFSGALTVQALIHGIHAACALALLVGYRTRLATVLCWILFVSLNNRVPMIFNGADNVIRVMLFWSIFLPLGARWSLDRRAGRTGDGPALVFSAASVAILVQVASIYLFSALLKDHDAWVVDANAVGLALRLDLFSTPIGELLLDAPALLSVASIGTYYLELVGPLLAFVPVAIARTRVVLVVAFVLFHLALRLCLELAYFPALMAVTWILFLPPALWDRFAARQESPARRRTSSVAVHGLVATLLVCVTLWNVKTASGSITLPRFVEAPVRWLHLTQWWGLFAPRPYTNDGWIVIAATLENGDTIDLFRNGAPLTFEKPEDVAGLYRHERWRKYTRNLITRPWTWHCERFVAVHQRWWRDDHPTAPRVDHVELFHMQEDTLPDLTEAPPKKVMLWSSAP